jgi:hypothetical protein
MGATLTVESPEVERMRDAAADLNVAEALLVRDLPAASARRAAELADRVGAARHEFNRAFAGLQAVL